MTDDKGQNMNIDPVEFGKMLQLQSDIAKDVGEIKTDVKQQAEDRLKDNDKNEKRFSALERWRTGLTYIYGAIMATLAVWFGWSK